MPTSRAKKPWYVLFRCLRTAICWQIAIVMQALIECGYKRRSRSVTGALAGGIRGVGRIAGALANLGHRLDESMAHIIPTLLFPQHTMGMSWGQF